jgi:ryanodine receptor 2
MMNYNPKPIETSEIQLSGELIELSELLAKNAHDVWAARRLSEGWEWGPKKNDQTKKSPNLIPFDELPESEKGYDRAMVIETLKAIIVLGFSIERQ